MRRAAAELQTAFRPIRDSLRRLAESWAGQLAVIDANPEWQRLRELAGAFDRGLAAAVAAHPGIDAATVRALLFPPDAGSPLTVLFSLRDLPALAEIDGRLRAALAAAETLDDRRVADALRAVLVSVAERRMPLEAKARAAKLGGPHRWRPYGEAQWTATPGELACRDDRFSHPEQWGLIGDRAAALAEYLARHVPGLRGRARGRVLPSDPLPYKTAALTLAAELVTMAYWIEFPSFQVRGGITAANVKAYLLDRRRKRRTVK